jgi:hypothetical protein
MAKSVKITGEEKSKILLIFERATREEILSLYIDECKYKVKLKKRLFFYQILSILLSCVIICLLFKI